MNTIRSVYVGWGALILAGGGAYYFAKKSINADKKARSDADIKRRRMQESLEYSNNLSTSPSSASAIAAATPVGSGKKRTSSSTPVRSDSSGSPSQEATMDPAPTRHAPDSEGQRILEKSKYEASEPFRARKGDRFS